MKLVNPQPIFPLCFNAEALPEGKHFIAIYNILSIEGKRIYMVLL